MRVWLTTTSAVCLALLGPPADAASVKVGQPAPPFKLTTFDGQQVTLDQLRGQVVVLNFWATWCGPCKQELPLLDAYYRGAQQYGLRVYAVATEDSVPEYQLKPLQKMLAFPMVRRMHGPYADMNAVPTNFVIDRAGVIRYAQAGAFRLDDLNELLIPLLNERSTTSGAEAAPVIQSSH